MPPESSAPSPAGADFDLAVLAGCEDLPSHRRVLDRVLRTYRADPAVLGALVGGSLVTGELVPSSDLEVVLVYADAAARDHAWRHRWEPELGAWLHRFVAGHLGPHVATQVLEPGVRVDLALRTLDDLWARPGSAFRVAWDTTGQLADWAARTHAAHVPPPDWTTVVEEEARFWGLVYDLIGRIERDELYAAAQLVPVARAIAETWLARLAGDATFDPGHIGRYPARDLGDLAMIFPPPERRALKTAIMRLLALHDRQRAEVGRICEPTWRTRDPARVRIEAMARAL